MQNTLLAFLFFFFSFPKYIFLIPFFPGDL